jgi:toxin CcdB
VRQFDVFENPSERSRGYAPYVLVLQSHHLSAIDTVVVAPLIADAARPLSLIDLPVLIGERSLVAALSELANMPRKVFKSPVVSLAGEEDAIRRALDRLFTGF